MTATGVLVVGASHAGVQVAASLRERGFQESITVVGAEPEQPYQRPPLSKAFLGGTASDASLELRSSSFFAEKEITVVLGDRVKQADPDAGWAQATGGASFTFGQLVLATGARIRRLNVPGRDLEGVHYLRDLRDARELAAGLRDATSVLVVGGGFIGLEIAAVAAKLGKQVTLVEADDQLMGRAVSRPISDYFLGTHRYWGVDVRMGQAVSAILEGRPGRSCGARLRDGTEVFADLLVVGIGVEPNAELAAQIGLNVGNGIVVDLQMRTSHPRVLAVGDCAALLTPGIAETVRLESVQNAVDQARTAAATICGTVQPHKVVPWFWSDQGELKLQIAGMPAVGDQTVLRGDPLSGKFSVLHFRGGRLAATECVNSPADYMTVRRALEGGLTVDAKSADSAATLKSLVCS